MNSKKIHRAYEIVDDIFKRFIIGNSAAGLLDELEDGDVTALKDHIEITESDYYKEDPELWKPPQKIVREPWNVRFVGRRDEDGFPVFSFLDACFDKIYECHYMDFPWDKKGKKS